MKKCFTCKRNKPLFLFYKNRVKHKLPTDKGVTVNCRLCETKKFIKNKGSIVRYNFIKKHFQVLQLKVNLINIIKIYYGN